MPDHSDSTADPRTDRELVRLFLETRGEIEFRALYRRHTPPLYRMAYRLAGPGLADDVLQETWCRAARNLGSFEWRSALRTWLTGILIRCCRQTWRDNGQVVTLPVGMEMHEPEVEAPSGTELDLERALESLPPGYREVLVLHDVEGLTHEEIARALNVVPGTSKSQLARARRALRQRLESGTVSPIDKESAR
ncbi:MAG TPA: RNA polymerase sigma factor [Woeseiaceae bacterium]|nr:RNA polymerase sigma factor [Woeseiaceae bacterium]